jgi:hypothetical protein
MVAAEGQRGSIVHRPGEIAHPSGRACDWV